MYQYFRDIVKKYFGYDTGNGRTNRDILFGLKDVVLECEIVLLEYYMQ
jgi:hypothetical protein